MASAPTDAFLGRLEARLGRRGFTRDPADMAPWLTDWRGRYTGRAAALLSPADTQEVRAIVTLCAAERVALVPQGGNSSLAGGATPSGDGRSLLLSLRRMRAIRSVSGDDNILVAEAGAILSDVHETALAIGRRFPLSLGAKGSATIGGLVSTNAGGTQVLRFGTMRALVFGLEAVMPDGALYEGLSALRKDNRGYDLRQLLVGAEGTLGVVTAASLRLVATPGSTAVAWAGLASPEDALALLRNLEDALGDAVESFELVPEDALRLVLAHIPSARAPLAASHPWNVLIEATSPRRDISDSLGAALADAMERGLIRDAALAASDMQAMAFWSLRENIAEAERKDGASAKHDVSVPVSLMPGFIRSAREAVERRFAGARVIAFGHLGDGNVHFNVRPPAGEGPEAWLIRHEEAVSALVYRLVADAGGSISAEHGIGQMKLAALAASAGAALLAAQRAIKAALDPDGIMNPGKLLGPA